MINTHHLVIYKNNSKISLNILGINRLIWQAKIYIQKLKQ